MKPIKKFSILLLLPMTAMLVSSNVVAQKTEMPKLITTPNAVETRIGTLKFEKGFPTEETKRKVFDEIDYQRAVQAYLWAYPVVSFQSIRIEAKRAFGL